MTVSIQYNIIILNWPLPIGAFQGQWNTKKRQNRTTTTVKNPNWPEANQLAILQVRLGSSTRDNYQDQIQRVVRAGLEPGISGSQGKHPNHWATPASSKNWFNVVVLRMGLFKRNDSTDLWEIARKAGNVLKFESHGMCTGCAYLIDLVPDCVSDLFVRSH